MCDPELAEGPPWLPDELVDLILRRYGNRKSREHLRFEAERTILLMRPELVPIGYMYPGRWRHIAVEIASDREETNRILSDLGLPVPKQELVQSEEDAARASRRLSVLLSTVRAVLDPDKRFAADHFVRADGPTVRLDTANVALDVTGFLEDAEEGLRLARAGEEEPAESLLSAAEASYLGDFLGEDAYEDWPVATRERARETYVQVARTLAGATAARGDHELAARYLLRVLEHDPYDEPAHLELVRAFLASGRHGQARRSYRVYSDRMTEIGVEATAFPLAQ